MKKYLRILFLAICLFSFIFTLQSCKKKYSITFDTNGGNQIESVEIASKKEYELPVPSKEGYEFAGWYTTKDLTGESVTKVTLDKSGITVYAKWEQTALITLVTDGGSLSTKTIQAKVGDSVYDLVKDLKPVKAGVEFGGWFVGNTEISANTKLTQKGITLTARYKALVTVNVYKQNLSLTDYDLTKEEVYAYVGTTYEPTIEEEGFKETNNASSVSSIVVSDKEANVLNIYLNRNKYTITFRSNYPTDDLEETKTITIVYGEEALLPDFNFQTEGYYILGYSETAGGEIVYKTHYIENLPLNLEEGEKTEFDPVVIKANRSMNLYAVWNKGYKDMFGGDDYIFIENDKIYLCRSGVYFVGEYFKKNKSFIFESKKETIEGKLFDNGTFAYYNAVRDEYHASLYEVGTGLNKNVTVYFDAYNGVKYSVYKDGSTSTSNGTYTIDEHGYYVIDFIDGDLEGKTKTIILGQVTLNNVVEEAFQERNQLEIEMGTLVRFGLNGNQLSYYSNGVYSIMLSGFGVLNYFTGSSYSQYYYTYDDETKILNMTNSSGQSVGICKVMEVNGVLGYMPYDSSLDVTFTNESGDTIKLDGMINITYTKDGVSQTGYYTVASSAFGGYIVNALINGENYKFLTKRTVETITVDDNKETIVHYTYVTKLETYAEYYYKNADGTYYAPLFVLDDEEEGIANVYGYKTTTKTYAKVLTGTYTYDEVTKLYTFTTTAVYEADVTASPLDVATIKKVVLSFDKSSTNYPINYWYSSILVDEENEYDVTYTGKDGSKLILVNGMAVLSKDGYNITGAYTAKAENITITTGSGSAYAIINNEDKTFVLLDYAPYKAYVVEENGTYSSKSYIEFDGLGNGTFVYETIEVVDEEEKAVSKSIKGVVTKLDEVTLGKNTVYEFASEEKTFRFIQVSNSSATFALPYYGIYYGEYKSSEGTLTLDGFGYMATFVNADGDRITGTYSANEQMIRLTGDNRYYYFDLDSRTFTLRSKEYGTYIVMENQGMPGLYLELDGYGKASLFKFEQNEDGESVRVYVDENAKYNLVETGVQVIYKDGINEITLDGTLSTYTYSTTTYNTFVIRHEEVVKVFVNTSNWVILKLSAIGTCVKVDSKGIEETGTFKIITDNLLYYVNDEGTDANIYRYDFEKGTITSSEFKARGYFTEDLKSLLFTRYGFAIFNNETRLYYEQVDEDIIIYRQEPENSLANEYGFVREVFGPLTSVKEYNGDTYYINDGFAVSFTRTETTKDTYPVLYTTTKDEEGNTVEIYACLEKLTFSPSGSDVFRETGTVYIYEKEYSCTVVRELVDEEYVMYVLVGGYRFDITAKYIGSDNEGNSLSTYEVIGLSRISNYYPYVYLDTYYMLYSFLGPQYANQYTNQLGMINMTKIYDSEGKMVEDTASVNLFEGSKAFDLNGEILKAEKASYTYLGNSIYSVNLTSTDGYDYKIYFALATHSAFNMVAYRVYAITRVERLTDGDFTLEVERVLATDANYEIGSAFAYKLFKGTEEVTYTEVFELNDNLYYVSRELDENNKIISTTYYKFTLTENEGESVGEETTENVVKTYKSVKVDEIKVTTKYATNDITYVDFMDDKIVFINLDGKKALVNECEYVELEGYYLITASTKKKYTVTLVEGGKVQIADYVER